MNNKCCDYAHYYFGNWFRFTWPDGDFIEDKFTMFNDGFICGYTGGVHDKNNFYEINDFRKEGNFQLMLRHPCDITQKQKRIYKKLCHEIKDLHNKKVILRYFDTPLSLDYMFKNGIDAFNLIESGDAIDVKQ